MDDTIQKKAIIIGAGIAGLSLAVRLQSKGIQVSVFEANTYPGGKLTELSKKGYRFDMGPSLFTMPQFVEELFSISNKNINHYFSYKKKDTVCHYFYKDGTFFKASSDSDTFSSDAANVFDVKKNTLINYFKKSKKKYELTSSLFLDRKSVV